MGASGGVAGGVPVPVTVILPCAGTGSRLGLPFPKELAPVARDRCLIDSCLDLVGRAEPGSCRVVLMDDGNREATVRYVASRLPCIPVARVRQPEHARDMPGAVLRLHPWWGPVNVLLLPDVAYDADGNLVSRLAAAAQEHGFAFAAAPLPQEQLRRAGAVRAENQRVTCYEDKPADPSGYDLAWGALAFTASAGGEAGLRQVARSTERDPAGPVTAPPVAGAPVVMFAGWRDCGTWDGYQAQMRGAW